MGSRKRRRRKMAKREDTKQFRSSLASILTAFETYGDFMTDKHFDVMRKTPFYLLFNALREGNVNAKDCHRSEAVTEDIMHVFDPVKKKLKLGSLNVGLTRNDVRLIFGIVDGEEPINLYKGTKSTWVFYNRMFTGDVYLNPKVVKDKLNEVFFRNPQSDVDIEDAVRLLCLLLFTTLFVPLKGFSLTWGWVEYVEELDRMREYDWCGMIVSLLVDSLSKNKTDPYKVVGCTMLLPYWLCEHASVIGARDCGDALPRFVRWHLPDLKKTVTRQRLMTLAADEVEVGELFPSDEESAMLASLKEYRGAVGTTSKPVKKMKKVVDDEGPPRKTRVGSVGTEKESDSLAKLYSDLVADHDELKVKCVRIEEEHKKLKEKLTEVVEGSRSHDVLVAKYEEEVMILNGKLLTSMGREEQLRVQYVVRMQERDALRKRVKVLEKELAAEKDINRVQSEKIEEMNDRWFEDVVEPEVHALTQVAALENWNDDLGVIAVTTTTSAVMEKSMDAQKVQIVAEPASAVMEKSQDDIRLHDVTPSVLVVKDKMNDAPDGSTIMDKSNVEQQNNQTSMIKRLKVRSRKDILIDDDFEYGSDVKKIKKRGGVPDDQPRTYKNNADFLAMLDRRFAGHCAKSINSKCLTKLVEKINKGKSETVYYNKHRMTVVDTERIMDIIKGVYISNSVVDAYGQYLVKTTDPVKQARMITIISGDCWHRVVKQNSKTVINEVIGAAIKNTGLVLLPILSTGNTNEVGAEHWTLLVMDVDDQEWRFYNSLRPRTGKTADKYLGDAKLLKEKLEIAMADKSSAALGYKVLESDTHLSLVEVPAPQQGETCDCGIFVCYFLRQLARNNELKTTLRKDVIRRFKAEVIESIMEC